MRAGTTSQTCSWRPLKLIGDTKQPGLVGHIRCEPGGSVPKSGTLRSAAGPLR